MAVTKQARRHAPSSGRRRAGTPRRAGPPSGARAADEVDKHVGSRLRLARKALDMTQEALASQLGVTFQQLQKYEKGTNRISASRLHRAAHILGVPVSYFFPEDSEAGEETAIPQTAGEAMAFLGTADGLELSRAFSAIEDAAVRKRVLELVRSIAQSARDTDKS